MHGFIEIEYNKIPELDFMGYIEIGEMCRYIVIDNIRYSNNDSIDMYIVKIEENTVSMWD